MQVEQEINITNEKNAKECLCHPLSQRRIDKK